MTPTTQDRVNQTAWAACDTFRGVVAGQIVVTNCASVPESQEPILDPVRIPWHELDGSRAARGRSDSADIVCIIAAGHHPVTVPLSWSPLVRLLSVRNEHARVFYEATALYGGWTVRQPGRLRHSQTATSRAGGIG